MLKAVSDPPTTPLEELKIEKFPSMPVEINIFVPGGFPFAPIVIEALVVKIWNPLIDCTADNVLVETVTITVFVDPVGFKDPD